MPLSKLQAREWAAILRGSDDATIRQPLWNWSPALRPLVIHERRVRWGVPTDEDFDPEYS